MIKTVEEGLGAYKAEVERYLQAVTEFICALPPLGQKPPKDKLEYINGLALAVKYDETKKKLEGMEAALGLNRDEIKAIYREFGCELKD